MDRYLKRRVRRYVRKAIVFLVVIVAALVWWLFFA